MEIGASVSSPAILRTLNRYSFVLPVLSWIGFGLASASSWPISHRLVLWISIAALIASVAALGAIHNRRSAACAVLSVTLSGILVAVELVLYMFGAFIEAV